MDSVTEKSCLEEISALVFDANEKVTLKTISNNWSIKYNEANKVTWTWLDQNESKLKNLQKEFLVQGINSKGNFCISVVSEEKKDFLEPKWEKFSSLLYSIELRTNTRRLDLPDHAPIKVKNILLKDMPQRDLKIPDISIVKEEPVLAKKVVDTKPKTPFSSMKPVIKSEIKKEAKVEDATTVVKSPDKKPASPVKESTKEVKITKQSPEDDKVKATGGKKTQLKNQKPVQKGSISSFFSNKPGTTKPVDKPKEKPAEKPAENPNKSKDESHEKARPSKTRKRSSSSSPEIVVVEQKQSVMEKKPAAKKAKLKELPNKRRSRILVMQDSSDEEEEEEENKSESDEPEAKFIKFDREITPEPRKAPSESDEQTPKKKSTDERNKRKGKRWVSKRYTTEDGFLQTERVQEEYSASEDENDENKKKNSPPKSRAAAVAEKKSSSEKKKTAKPKPAVAAAGKAKQGNITSFFTRK